MVIILLGLEGKTSGAVFIGGEITSCLLTPFSFMYSSKVNFISLAVKLVLKFFGKLVFKTGAIESFNPPVIEPLLAQPMAIIKSKTTAYLIRTFNINLKLRCHKITIIFSGKKMFCSFFRSK